MTERRPSRRLSEWLGVMLGEIDRKKQESAQAREERQRRERESAGRQSR